MSDEFNITPEDTILSQSTTERYRAALAQLAESDAFKVFEMIIRKQIEARKNEIIAMPIYDDKTIAARNLLVGEVTGMETIILLPVKAVAALKLEQEMNPKKEENYDGNYK